RAYVDWSSDVCSSDLRRTCMNPKCRRAVPFQEATVHHVIEHTAGGPTKLVNAVLVCTECASKRKELQAAEPELKKYLHSLMHARSEEHTSELQSPYEL